MMEVISCTRDKALKVRDILDWKVADPEILHKWLGEKNPLALELWHGHIENRKGASYCVRLAPMWQQSGTLLFCSCHGIAGFLVDELQI